MAFGLELRHQPAPGSPACRPALKIWTCEPSSLQEQIPENKSLPRDTHLWVLLLQRMVTDTCREQILQGVQVLRALLQLHPTDALACKRSEMTREQVVTVFKENFMP